MHPGRMIRIWLALAVLSSVLLAGVSHAAWNQTNGPKGGLIRSLLTVPNGAGGTSLFAGQMYVWRTDSNGASWTHAKNGLTDPAAIALLAVPNGFGGNDILVGTSAGVFRSTNNGGSWSPSNSGIGTQSIYALASGSNGSGGTNLYAGTNSGNVFRSTDNGASWTAVGTPMPGGFGMDALTTTSSGAVLVGSNGHVYRSTNYGASWTKVFDLYGFSFAKHGGAIYAGTSNGVYRSTNDGVSWTPINSGMGFVWVRAMAAVPNGPGVTLFAGAGGVLRSTDNGATWTSASSGLPILGVYALTTAPNPSGGTDLYAGTSEGVYRSTDNGDSWTNASFISSYVKSLVVGPSGAVFAATENHIFSTGNGGATWTDTHANMAALDFAINPHGIGGPSLFAGGAMDGIFKSTDAGATWASSNNDIADIEVNSITAVPNGAGGTNLIAGTYSGIAISANDGASWQTVEPNSMPLDCAVVPNGSGGHTIFGGGFGGVYVSTNYGFTWSFLPSNLGSNIVQGMAVTGNGTNLFAAGDPFGIYRSTNNGASWTPVNDGITDLRVSTLLSPDGRNLFASGGGGIYLSADHGDHWTSVGDGLTTGVQSLALSADQTTLIAGTSGYGVWTRPLSEMMDVTAVSTESAPPAAAALRAYPNPFNPNSTIEYFVPKAGPVRLAIHDVSGRLVRRLVDRIHAAGDHRVSWDGRNDRGSHVGSGVYLFRLDAGSASVTRKVSLLK